MTTADRRVEQANSEARRARRMSIIWWVQCPLVALLYWWTSSQLVAEKLMLTYLAEVSVIALAVSYATKAKSAEAKAASYENP